MLLPLSVLWFSLGSCGHRQTDFRASDGDTLALHHARNLIIVEHDGYTEVTIRNPWDTTAVLHRYSLDEREGANPDREATHVRVPLRAAGVFTSVHCGLMLELGCGEAIRGVCEVEYINLPDVLDGVGEGRIANFGNSMEPTIEVIMDAAPDALLISPFENTGGYGHVERLGIPIIACADYMEVGPLARAEWMKFYGRLFGCAERADSLFAAIEKRYNALRQAAARVAHRPTLIAETPYSGVWYVPGGGSVMGMLYGDAGADYLFADRPESGSLALSVETVFEVGQQADVWLVKYNRDTPLTLSQLKSDYPSFAHFRSFRSGRVYGCNQAVVPFYEEVPFHPDWLLADLIYTFHPELGIVPEKHYFYKLEP